MSYKDYPESQEKGNVTEQRYAAIRGTHSQRSTRSQNIVEGIDAVEPFGTILKG